jgi:hypothetical protein
MGKVATKTVFVETWGWGLGFVGLWNADFMDLAGFADFM